MSAQAKRKADSSAEQKQHKKLKSASASTDEKREKMSKEEMETLGRLFQTYQKQFEAEKAGGGASIADPEDRYEEVPGALETEIKMAEAAQHTQAGRKKRTDVRSRILKQSFYTIGSRVEVNVKQEGKVLGTVVRTPPGLKSREVFMYIKMDGSKSLSLPPLSHTRTHARDFCLIQVKQFAVCARESLRSAN